MSSLNLQVQENGDLAYQDEPSSVGEDSAGEAVSLNELEAMNGEGLITLAASSSVSRPFGSKPQKYAGGTILPSHVSKDQMNTAVKKFYDKWKKAYVVRPCNSTSQYAVKGGQTHLLAVSEGQGYGMLITVLMAGYDSKAREIFDGIHRFTRSKGSKTSPLLMAWAIDKNCKVSDPYPAADGDLDMALALLMADKQWGSKGSINYLAEAKKTIGAIKAKLVSPQKYVMAGPAGLTRTSDMMIGHFRAFKKATNDAVWTQIIDKSFSLLNTVVNNYAKNTGLHPDFIKNADKNNPSPPTTKMIESYTEGFYAWNACRNPWRFGTDFAMSSDSRSKNLTQKIMNFFKSKSGNNPSKIYSVYNLNGNAMENYSNMSFQAPIGVGAIVDKSNQTILNNLWTMMANKGLEGYYPDSIRLISLLVMSGNWWQP